MLGENMQDDKETGGQPKETSEGKGGQDKADSEAEESKATSSKDRKEYREAVGRRRSKILEKVEQAKEEKPQFEDVDKKVKKLIDLLQRKNKGETINEDEKKSLLELLLEFFKYLLKELKDYISDEEGEYRDIFEYAKTDGITAPEDVQKLVTDTLFKDMLGAFGIEDEDGKNVAKAVHEEKVEKFREHLVETGIKPSEVKKRTTFARQGIPGGGPDDDYDYYARMDEDAFEVDRARRTGFMEDFGNVISNLERTAGMTPAYLDLAPKYRDLEGLRQKVEGDPTNKSAWIELMIAQDKFKGDIRRIFGEEGGGQYLQIYGKRAVGLMNRIDEHRDAGIFDVLTASDAELEQLRDSLDFSKDIKDIKSFTVAGKKFNEGELKGEESPYLKFLEEMKKVKENDLDIKELREILRRKFISPLFEDIIGDAESDPRQGFQMQSWAHILFNELTESLKEAGTLGANERRRYESFFFARWGFHSLNTAFIRGGNYRELVENSRKLLLGEDLDILMQMVPGMSAAVRETSRVIKRFRMDPKNNGRLPYELFIPHPRKDYEPPPLEREVVRSLEELSERGVLRDPEGNKVKIDKDQAHKISGLAIKFHNITLLTAEEISRTPFKYGAAELISTHQDEARMDMIRTMKRFGTWTRGREAAFPIARRLQQFIQPGVWEKIPGNDYDEWGRNPENFLDAGGAFTGSSWRPKETTKQQRDKGLAKSVEIQFEKKGEEKEKVKDRVEEWKKVARHNPTAIAEYWPTVVLRKLERGEGDDVFFDFDERLRRGIIDDEGVFNVYLGRVLENRIKEEGYDEEVIGWVKNDVKAGHIKELSGKDHDEHGGNKEEYDKRWEERRKEVKTQIGGHRSFFWMVGENTGFVEKGKMVLYDEKGTKIKEFTPDKASEKDIIEWERQVNKKWQDLSQRLSVLQEHALQEYLEKGYETGNEGEYKEILELVEANALGLEFSDGEKKVVERLTHLGGKDVGEAGVGAERLASVEFSFIPFTEDIVHEKVDWLDRGPRVISRRYNDMHTYWEQANELFTRITRGLAGSEDKIVAHRKELIKGLAEFYDKLGHMGADEQFEATAWFANNIVEKLYKEDKWWLNIPLIGPLWDWGGPFNLWKPWAKSSPAQRKFGGQALSMNAVERYQFVNDLRPYIGNEHADKLQKLLKARLGDAIVETVWRWWPLAPIYVIGKWVSAAIEGLKAESEATLKGQ
jgi:hypothetical protein